MSVFSLLSRTRGSQWLAGAAVASAALASRGDCLLLLPARRRVACAERSAADEAGGTSLRFAAIADIQYADVEDRRGRRYRATLPIVEKAAAFFQSRGKLHFTLHAGDIIDFYNTEGSFANDGGRATSNAVAAVMSRLTWPSGPHLVSLIGNHELYNWSREQLLQGVPWKASSATNEDSSEGSLSKQGTLRFCPEGSSDFWHAFRPCEGWCCIVLDSFDVSMYRNGRGPKPAPYSYEFDEHASAELCRRNGNVAKFMRERPGENILCDYFEGLPSGVGSRWVPFNGGIGMRQLAWLRDELEVAANRSEKVVVLTHANVHPDSAPDGRTLLWNYDEVLDVLQSPAGRTVQMVLTGHRHSGGLSTDEFGIHYVIMESPLNSGPEMPGAYFVVEANSSHIELAGYGNAQSPIFADVPEGTLGCVKLPLRNAACHTSRL